MPFQRIKLFYIYYKNHNINNNLTLNSEGVFVTY